MKPFDCLDPKQPISGKIFLEASAGTGKTFAIEHIICRLILRGFSLKQILITTFTKKGVRDLRRRIFENLKWAQSLLKQGGALPHYLASIEDPRESLLMIEHQIAFIEEAEIHTIHSFCYRSLTEYAFEAGIHLSDEDPESEEKRQEVATAILDTLRTTLDDTEFSPAQLMRLMAYFQRDTIKLVKKIAAFLENDSTITSYSPYSQMKKQFEDAMSSIDKERLKDKLYAAAPSYKKCANKKGELFPFVTQQIEKIDDFEALIAASPSIFDLFIPSNLKKGESHDLTLIDSLRPIVQEASDPLITFIRLSEKAKRRVDLIAMKNPNNLIDTMLSSLKSTAFCAALRKRFSAVIVDEFQDTDPKQTAIFSTLFRKSADPFVVVGDPKQSIYAFRGADLSAYLEAKKLFDHHYLLSTNYRSTKSIINTLNHLFDENELPGLFTFQDETLTLTHLPVEAGLEIDHAVSVQAVHTEQGEEALIDFIAAEAAKLKLPLSSMAILVKDRYQAERVTLALEKQGIPALSTASGSITETKAFGFVEIAFKVISHIRDLSSLNQFLSHPFVDRPFEQLTTDLTDPSLLEPLSIFARLKQLSPMEYLRALLQERFVDKPIIEKVAENEADYGDLMQLIELIFSIDRSHPLDAIAKLKRESNDQALKRRPLKESDAIHLMTMHMSKGLEFDIVFPIGMIAPSNPKQEFIKTKEAKIVRHSDEDPNAFRQLLNEEQEKMRLLYVALTRAKKGLYLFFLTEKRTTPPKIGSASLADLWITRLIAKVPLSLKQTYEAIPLNRPDKLKPLFDRFSIPLREVDTSHQQLPVFVSTQVPEIPPPKKLILNESPRVTLSFTALAEKTPKIPHIPVPLKEDLLPPGSMTGSLFHLLFEKIIEIGLYSPWKEDKIDALIEKDLSFSHLSGWMKEVKELIYTAFHTPLTHFCLYDIHYSSMLQESEFLFSSPYNYDLKGFVDLAFRHEDKYYLLDWKLNLLNNYTQESLEEAMKEHQYLLQASIYTEALKRYTALIDPHTPFEELYGGAFYFFLRGKEKGIYHYKPEFTYA